MSTVGAFIARLLIETESSPAFGLWAKDSASRRAACFGQDRRAATAPSASGAAGGVRQDRHGEGPIPAPRGCRRRAPVSTRASRPARPEATGHRDELGPQPQADALGIGSGRQRGRQCHRALR